MAVTGTVELAPEPLTSEEARRQELADFLRTRRERVTPDRVGLPPGGRRRTPGLRREEVAQLSGVGVTWYTWLEQGRDIKVSESVLDAVCRTLLLDPFERDHVFTLAGAPSGGIRKACSELHPNTHRILERLGSYPGVVLNGRYDILAYNRAYAGLMGDIESLPFDERNTMWLMFTHDGVRSLLSNWDLAVRRCVAQYRSRMAGHAGEPAWRAMVDRLRAASPEFDAVWAHHDVAPSETLLKQFDHPELGPLRFDATSLGLAEQVATRMVAYVPADEVTAEAAPRLLEVTPRNLA